MSAEVFLKGDNVNRKLVELAENAVNGIGDGKISLQDAKLLLEKMKEIKADSKDFTNSVDYIQRHYHWSNIASKWFMNEFSKMRS